MTSPFPILGLRDRKAQDSVCPVRPLAPSMADLFRLTPRTPADTVPAVGRVSGAVAGEAAVEAEEVIGPH